MRALTLIFILVTGAGLLRPAAAEAPRPQAEVEYDFYLSFVQCKVIGATHGLRDPKVDALKVMKIEGHAIGCRRTARRAVSCAITFEDGSKPAFFDGTITVETSTNMTIESANGGDFFSIQPAKGSVIGLTRMASSDLLASKVCRGMYLTADEAAEMERVRRRPKKR